MTMKIEIDMTQHADAVWAYQTAKHNLEEAKKYVASAETTACIARSSLDDAKKKFEKASADLSARFAGEAVPKMSVPQDATEVDRAR